MTCEYWIIKTKAADDMVVKGARALAAMVFIWLYLMFSASVLKEPNTAVFQETQCSTMAVFSVEKNMTCWML